MSNEVMRQLFADKVQAQFNQNKEKYGEQSPEKLLQVAQVQLGHITDQHLKGGVSDKFRIEIIHLSAVLYDLYGA